MSQSVLINGSNRGIGLELVKTYLNQGFKVTAICRTPSEQLSSLPVKVFSHIDFTNFEKSYEELFAGLTDLGPIDIFWHNAGILLGDHLDSFSPQSLTDQFITNSVAPVYWAKKLIPFLNQGARIGFVTSRMGSIADNGSGGQYGYRMSKAALNAGAKSLSLDLRERGISVSLYHPGYVKTDMTGFNGLITPEESAALLFERMEAQTLENSGTFWHANGEQLPW
jgi:NAD(P)-dependent dehydrogenase (short-subunit alcohol dehydrogenase family)